MKLPSRKPGVSRFIFVALLLVFNWPILSIPKPVNLFGWLFAAWALAIALLFLAAQCAGNGEENDASPGGSSLGTAYNASSPKADQAAGQTPRQDGGADV